MNKWIGMGRLCKDPEISVSTSGTQIAKYSIAVDRKFKREGQPTADFFNCTSFGKQADFVEKYLKKGMKVVVAGSIQMDTYTTKTGEKKTSTNVMVEDVEFAESKSESKKPEDNFLNIADSILEELPFA